MTAGVPLCGVSLRPAPQEGTIVQLDESFPTRLMLRVRLQAPATFFEEARERTMGQWHADSARAGRPTSRIRSTRRLSCAHTHMYTCTRLSRELTRVRAWGRESTTPPGQDGSEGLHHLGKAILRDERRGRARGAITLYYVVLNYLIYYVSYAIFVFFFFRDALRRRLPNPASHAGASCSVAATPCKR